MNKIRRIEKHREKTCRKIKIKRRQINVMNLLIERNFSQLHRESFLRTILGVT